LDVTYIYDSQERTYYRHIFLASSEKYKRYSLTYDVSNINAPAEIRTPV